MSLDDLNDDGNETPEPQQELGDGLDGAFVSSGARQANKGALGVLVMLAAFGGGLYFMYLHSGPQSASAATAEQAAATTTIDDFLHGNGGNAKLMEQTLRDTEKVVQEFQSTAAKTQIPVSDLTTNPFRMKAPETPGMREDDSSARSREQLAAEKARIAHEAAALELQSVLRGGKSACMINNSMYHAGDSVSGFTVEEIRARSVIVRQGPCRFELTMKR